MRPNVSEQIGKSIISTSAIQKLLDKDAISKFTFDTSYVAPYNKGWAKHRFIHKEPEK